MAKFGFDPKDYKNSKGGGGGLLPDGKYLLAAEKAEPKDTANGEGINAMFDVVDGEYAGRKVFLFFNTVNTSEKAQQIGREQLATWARVCGKPGASDTDQLIGVPFMAEIYTEKAKKDSQYGDSNRIGKWFMKDGSEPADVAGVGGTSTTEKPAEKPAEKPKAPAAGAKKNPWED